MFKLGFVLFCVLIVGDRIGSLTGSRFEWPEDDKIQEATARTILQDIEERLVRIEDRQAAEKRRLAAIKETVAIIKRSLAPQSYPLHKPSPIQLVQPEIKQNGGSSYADSYSILMEIQPEIKQNGLVGSSYADSDSKPLIEFK